MKNPLKCSAVFTFSAMVFAGGIFAASPATAENIKAVCEEVLGEEGAEDFTGCQCLQDYVKDNAELEAHLITLRDKGPGIEPRMKVATDEGKKALMACFTPPEKK